MNKRILKLENNKEYFMISELNENNINYLLLMNVDNESDVKIVKRISSDQEDYIEDVVQGDLLIGLKQKFKSLVEAEKKSYI